MKTKQEQIRKIYYKRFSKNRLYHFSPAPGYNCPKIPLGGIDVKGPDYEIVKVVRTEGNCKHLKGRRVLISWGLNLTVDKRLKVKQVLAFEDNRNRIESQKHAEIVLAAAC